MNKFRTAERNKLKSLTLKVNQTFSDPRSKVIQN